MARPRHRCSLSAGMATRAYGEGAALRIACRNGFPCGVFANAAHYDDPRPASTGAWL